MACDSPLAAARFWFQWPGVGAFATCAAELGSALKMQALAEPS
jgi:hypothetical protein